MREGLTTIGELIAGTCIVVAGALVCAPLGFLTAGVVLGALCWLVAR